MVCQLRGRLKQGPREGDVVALGDWVIVTPLNEEKGIIEEKGGFLGINKTKTRSKKFEYGSSAKNSGRLVSLQLEC